MELTLTVCLNETTSKNMFVGVDAGMYLIVNLSEKVIINMSVSINLNKGSIMITYMNIGMCMNLPMSRSESKNMNECVSMRVFVSLTKSISNKINLEVYCQNECDIV